MRRSRPQVFASLFCLLLATMFVGLLLMPRQQYSDLEKRVLAKPPVFTWDSGVFSSQSESFMQDHLPLRPQWIGMDAYRRLFGGLNIADEIWRLPGGQLVEAPISANTGRLHQNIDRLQAFAEQTAMPLTLLLVPDSGAISPNLGPLPFEDKQLLEDAAAHLNGAAFVPLYESFFQADEALYYSTDPHWNAQGAYLAYSLAGPALGYTPWPKEAFKVRRSPNFYGTNYARSALWMTPTDVLEMWDAGQRLSLFLDNQPQAHTSLFFEDHLNNPDQYPVFLDGNHGLVHISNLDSTSQESLLLIKDSFGNSLVPLLIPHFQRITVVDLRAYRGSLTQLLAQEPYNRMLAVYSVRNLSMNTNLAWLR